MWQRAPAGESSRLDVLCTLAGVHFRGVHFYSTPIRHNLDPTQFGLEIVSDRDCFGLLLEYDSCCRSTSAACDTATILLSAQARVVTLRSAIGGALEDTGAEYQSEGGVGDSRGAQFPSLAVSYGGCRC